MRVDSGVTEGSEISPLYDPMIAKLIVRGADREDAIGRMLRALGEFQIGGVKTLIGFHKALLSHPCFRAGETCHGIVESELLALRGAGARRGAAAWRDADRGRNGRARDVCGGRRPSRRGEGARARAAVSRARPPPAGAGGVRRGRRRLRPRDEPDAGDGPRRCGSRTATPSRLGQVLCIVEAMKMENEVTAHRAGVVADLSIAVGQPVTTGQAICVIEAGPA